MTGLSCAQSTHDKFGYVVRFTVFEATNPPSFTGICFCCVQRIDVGEHGNAVLQSVIGQYKYTV